MIVKRIINLFKREQKLKVYMYANGHLVKVIKVPMGEDIYANTYIIRCIGKKYIFGSNCVQMVVKPVRMLKNEKIGEIHTTIELENGVEI